MNVIRIITFLAITICFGIAEITEREPEKLSELRESWKNAKARANRSIKTSYLNALVHLRTKLTRQEKLNEAALVQREIDELANNLTAEIDTPKKKKNSTLIELSHLRSTYERDMAEMIRKNDTIYRRSLMKLKAAFAQSEELEAALAISKELEILDKKESENGFCTIEISSNVPIKSHQMKKGTARLSGGYRPTFEKIDESLTAYHFLRVP